MKVLYLFGPNLGALGRRDPQTYGSETLEDIMTSVTQRGVELGHEVGWRQSITKATSWAGSWRPRPKVRTRS